MLRTFGAERSSAGVKGTDRHGNGWLNLQRSSHLYPISFIPGRVNASPSNTKGGSPVRESRPPGSVRGVPSNGHSYRDRSAEGRSGITERSDSALSNSFLEVSRTPPPCHLAEFRGEAFGICATLLTAYFGCQRSSVGFSSVTHIFQATNPIPTRPPRASLSFPEPHLLHRENAAATLQAH